MDSSSPSSSSSSLYLVYFLPSDWGKTHAPAALFDRVLFTGFVWKSGLKKTNKTWSWWSYWSIYACFSIFKYKVVFTISGVQYCSRNDTPEVSHFSECVLLFVFCHLNFCASLCGIVQILTPFSHIWFFSEHEKSSNKRERA